MPVARQSEAVVPDGNFRFAQHSEVEIGKETLSDTDLFSVVAVEWLVDDDLVISDVPEQTFDGVECACVRKTLGKENNAVIVKDISSFFSIIEA